MSISFPPNCFRSRLTTSTPSDANHSAISISPDDVPLAQAGHPDPFAMWFPGLCMKSPCFLHVILIGVLLETTVLRSYS